MLTSGFLVDFWVIAGVAGVGLGICCMLPIIGVLLWYRRVRTGNASATVDVEGNTPDNAGISALDMTIGSSMRPSSSTSDWQVGGNIRSASPPSNFA
jgi:hypothetical protein